MKISNKLLAGIVSVVILSAIIAAFVTVGSPARQRQINFDLRRVSDLQKIQNEIVFYWQQKGKLPSTSADLTDSISGFKAPVDPETGEGYEYVIKSDLDFVLCATFKLQSDNQESLYNTPYTAKGEENWNHGAGKTCFDRTIDPDLYKPLKQIPVK